MTSHAHLLYFQLLQDCIGRWAGQYSENHAHFSNLQNAVDDQFPAIYQSLILSPAVNTILQLEHTYAASMGRLIKTRDDDVQSMEGR